MPPRPRCCWACSAFTPGLKYWSRSPTSSGPALISQMKVFIITGASDGIGAEIARQLAVAHGAQAGLVLAARSQEKLDAVAQRCRASGAQTLVVRMSVSEEAQCRAL